MKPIYVFPFATLFLFYMSTCLAASPEEWKSRSIYQVLTDRFATHRTVDKCSYGNYCGGTYKGMVKQLDYITSMGFDAIWISPIIENSENGYHGYWASNMYKLNPEFGTPEDFKEFVNECHKRDIWVMVDVVANHMAHIDLKDIIPFNQSYHYHSCSNCPSSCNIENYNNQYEVEVCRISGLYDLDQSNPEVVSLLNDWIRDLVKEYSIDGIRVDTVKHVQKDFWPGFEKASGVYAIGEVFEGSLSYVGDYQKYMTGLLAYPLYYQLMAVFGQSQTMKKFEEFNAIRKNYYKDINLLGNFIDNHDNPRFLHKQGDVAKYKNALAYVMLTEGIPIIYYGTEQEFSGGEDPYCREPLWESGYDKNKPVYAMFTAINKARKDNQVWKHTQIQRYADESFYAFSRGNIFLATTNVGSNGGSVERTINYHPYKNGDKLCDILDNNYCVNVQNNEFRIQLVSGNPRILVLSAQNVSLLS